MEQEVDIKKVNEILDSYIQSIETYRKALRIAQIPESLIEKNIIYMPDYSKMIAEDIVAFYEQVRIKTILHFQSLGFSYASIARILSKNTVFHVRKLAKKANPPALTVAPEEVRKPKKK